MLRTRRGTHNIDESILTYRMIPSILEIGYTEACESPKNNIRFVLKWLIMFQRRIFREVDS